MITEMVLKKDTITSDKTNPYIIIRRPSGRHNECNQINVGFLI